LGYFWTGKTDDYPTPHKPVDRPDEFRYTAVPACQTWLIPFYDDRDRAQFDEVAYMIATEGPEHFADAFSSFRRAVRSSPRGVKFYVGTNLPGPVTVQLVPETREQASECLRAAGSASRGLATGGVFP